MNSYFIYILASRYHGTLYIGVTSNLVKRVYQHRNDLVEGFTNKYKVHDLVYYEEYYDVRDAIKREKNLKAWKREWKIELIESKNSNWKDLYQDML